jgi:hypothetical protein
VFNKSKLSKNNQNKMNVTKIAVALVAATQAVNISTSTAGLVQYDEADIADTLSHMPALVDFEEEESPEFFMRNFKRAMSGLGRAIPRFFAQVEPAQLAMTTSTQWSLLQSIKDQLNEHQREDLFDQASDQLEDTSVDLNELWDKMMTRFSFAEDGSMPELSAEDEEVLAEFWGFLATVAIGLLPNLFAETDMPAPANWEQASEIIAAQQDMDVPALSAEDEEIMAEFWGTVIFGILGIITSKC